jgi:seryl-tRNA synthetase
MIPTRNSSKPLQRRRRIVQSLSKNARKRIKLNEDITKVQTQIQKMQCKLEHLMSQLKNTEENETIFLQKFEIIIDDEVDFIIEDTDDDITDDDMECKEWYPCK